MVAPSSPSLIYATGRKYDCRPRRPERRPLRCPAYREQVVRALAAGLFSLCRGAALDPAEILRARNAALSVGRASYGTRAQLRHRRRPGALHVDERLQRASSYGLGFVRTAGGERRYPEQHAAARVDVTQHRRHEGADETPGLCLRLVARSYHLHAGLLQMEPVVLHQAVRERS